VAKADPVVTLVSGSTYTAVYAVTVSNTGTAAGSYTLSDTPGFPAGVTLNSSSVTTSGGTLNAPLPTLANNSAAQISAAGVAIAAGATHTYTVTINFTTSAAVTALACNGSANNGAYNVATLSGGATGSDAGCAALPGVGAVAVAKGDPVIANVSGNQYTATYTVTVNNSGTGAATYTLSDTPGFPAAGVTLNSLNATTAGGTLGGGAFPRVNPANNTAQQISAAGVAIAAGATHTYTVVITFTTSAAATALACNGSANNGAYNVASIAGTSTASDAGCANIPAPSLSLAKSAPTPALAVGVTSTYTLTVTNGGTAAATTAQVRDAIPANMNYVGFAGSGWSCTPTGSPAVAGPTTVTCNFTGSIASTNGTSALTISVVPLAASAGTTVTNRASVDPTGGSTPPDPTTCTGSNTPSAGCATRVDTVPAADMSPVLTLPTVVSPGAAITGTLVCSNSSATNAATGATCTSPTAGVTVNNCRISDAPATVVTPPFTVPAGGNVTCTVTATAPTTGTLPITATTSATNETAAATANNSTSATVNVIDAVNDTAQTITSTASIQVVPGGSVLTSGGNDTVGGNPATTGNVTITPTLTVTGGPTTVGWTINTTTGEISAPANVAAGVYSVQYQICSNPAVSPAACDSATRQVTVLAAADVVSTITGLPLTVAPGATVAGVLTCTNVGGQTANAVTCSAATAVAGAIVTVSNCTPASGANLSVSPAAGSSIVCDLVVTAPANPAAPDSDVSATAVLISGNTTASNEPVAQQANNTSSASVAIIDAINDTGSVGSVAGGLVPILTNDQLGATVNPTVGLNGIKVPTIVSGPNTTLAGATIDAATNQIRVPAGTLPGAYTVEYEICTDPDTVPLACDRAIATINVTNTQVDVVSAVSAPAIVGPGQTIAGEIVCTNNGAIAATGMTCTALTSTPGASVSVGTCVAEGLGSTLTSVQPGGALRCPLTIIAPGVRGGADEAATQVLINSNTSATNETLGNDGNNANTGSIAIIDAINDAGSVGSVAGGTINLIGNDRLGSSASAPSVGMGGVLAPTIVVGPNTNLATATIDPVSGLLNVPAGTAPGTYSVEYQLCAQSVSTACDRAIASITVSDTTADMVSAINGLPPSIAPGQTVNGTLVCTNTGPAVADSPTCTVSTSTPGATAVISGACSPALPVSSLAATAPNNTISCPITVTAPSNAGALSEVSPISVVVNGTTSATNESAPQQSNNASTASVTIIDALNDSATIGSLSGGILNVLTNDQNGATTPPTVGAGGSNSMAQTGGTAPVGGTVLTLNPATGVITVPAGSVAGTYTVTYDLCSVPATTPTPTCDSAVATIVVDDTSADMTSQIVGLPVSIGPGSTVTASLVCTNGGPFIASSPTCTIATSTAGATVTITGACVASMGSTLTALQPAGTITCPISLIAPSNPAAPGDVAAASITVTSNTSASNEPVALQTNNGDSEVVAIVDAVNDTANIGAAGGSVNLLINDSNGSVGAAVGGAGNATIVQQPGATAPAGGTPLTLDPGTGLVAVPANAVPGVYTVPYQLCSTTPSTACDTAVATIVVAAGAADMAASFAASGPTALPIAVAPGQTYSGLQLTCTNEGLNLAIAPSCAVSVSVGSVSGFTCTPSSPAVLSPGAAIVCTFNYTAPGTLGGTDTPPVSVQFTGITNASNDTNSSNNLVQGVAPGGNATIVIDAIDNSATIESSTGGTVPILTNDQLGATLNPSISASGITAPVIIPGAGTTLPGATINSSNEVVVQPGTLPGVYTVEYEICAQVAPTVCDRAIVTITIAGEAAAAAQPIPTLDPRLLLALVALMAFVGMRRGRRS
jgi:uncharacterized repeat protein (TIGR01451 family)